MLKLKKDRNHNIFFSNLYVFIICFVLYNSLCLGDKYFYHISNMCSDKNVYTYEA